MASEKYYNELGDKLLKAGLGLDEKYLYQVPFSNGGEGYPPSKMKSLVLNHPNHSSVKMLYKKGNTYYVFTRSKKSTEDLVKAFDYMLNIVISNSKEKVEIVRIKSR